MTDLEGKANITDEQLTSLSAVGILLLLQLTTKLASVKVILGVTILDTLCSILLYS